MPSKSFALRAVLLCVLGLGLVPAVSHAWQVTVYVHGAGGVDEVTARNLTNCTTSLEDVSESTTTVCTGGSPSGGYGHGDIVELDAYVTSAQSGRGWVFKHWAEGTGTGQVNCDPQGTPTNHTSARCRFQIWENLSIHLYFDDTSPPNTTSLTGTPSVNGARVNYTSAAFEFAGSDSDSRFDCKLDRPGDAGAWEPCGSAADKAESYSALAANGVYTFSVRARDPSGNVDGTPLSRSWTVDTVAPTTSITGGPSGTVTSATASFTFGASEALDTYFCKLDSGVYTQCSSGKTYTNLADGPHTFSVYAIDQAGNVGPAASRTFTVDTTKPVTTITGGPSGQSSSDGATFSFSASEDATFECALDGGPFAACTSPHELSGLADGAHSFAVRAIDRVGHVGDPVIRAWSIDRTPPDTAIGDGPAEGATVSDTRAAFSFSSPEPGTSFECRIDTEAFAPCTSPYTRENLANGDHVFEVRARDAAGNVDATPARRAWTINSLDADRDGFNRPQDCNDADAAIRPGATDVPDNGIDEDCSGADAVNLDRDGDGAARPLDCNDGDAAIRPGAADAPRDGVDQDCDGRDADFATVAGSLRYVWAYKGASTWARTLRLSGVTKGAVVRVTCKGRGCPFKAKSVKPTSKGAVDVKKLLRNRKLRSGTTLELRITAPGMIARVVSFKMRRGKGPSGGRFACLVPGAKKPAPCS